MCYWATAPTLARIVCLSCCFSALNGPLKSLVCPTSLQRHSESYHNRSWPFGTGCSITTSTTSTMTRLLFAALSSGRTNKTCAWSPGQLQMWAPHGHLRCMMVRNTCQGTCVSACNRFTHSWRYSCLKPFCHLLRRQTKDAAQVSYTRRAPSRECCRCQGVTVVADIHASPAVQRSLPLPNKMRQT